MRVEYGVVKKVESIPSLRAAYDFAVKNHGMEWAYDHHPGNILLGPVKDNLDQCELAGKVDSFESKPYIAILDIDPQESYPYTTPSTSVLALVVGEGLNYRAIWIPHSHGVVANYISDMVITFEPDNPQGEYPFDCEHWFFRAIMDSDPNADAVNAEIDHHLALLYDL